ncbi:LLM class flavin-dependent oxidoreductase [Gordonia humi]|uniref:Alkanesulfonate monooxygenase SsuD/methylene tetrahydromethanopterin reductase-like flavin-dependent oxidoreductase (Luciferase family) n=2 Tax=Gordonia humi TaxID=686429 RepID=A0A840F936_9ACTN|nr:alkanesulfonate monooxygenase SsuD/methylene tetrahydromethanopterin reductase-like flavin-dependent oxidoreductase (luciferase family) [Gordonia humi]
MTLIARQPDPVTGEPTPTAQRFREVVDHARLAEELGFDGFGVGERHERPFLSSAPAVWLSHLAALTTEIRLFTTVATLALVDPVRAFEDYATLDHLSDGRLELMIGKGNGSAQRDLFAVTEDDQWARNAESFEVFSRLWADNRISADTRFRPALRDVEVWPEPLQRPLRIWHGSATSTASVELAVAHGDPIFSANVTHRVEPYAALVRHYREQWAAAGRDPAHAAVGAGTAGLLVAPRSQDAVAAFAPAFAHYLAAHRQSGVVPAFATLDEFVTDSSALIGSPQQVIDKLHRYHEQLGHSVVHVPAEPGAVDPAAHRESMALFASDVVPRLGDLPDPPWGWGSPDAQLSATHPKEVALS